MRNQLLHIYRNTPFGRETFMQSEYFCRQLRLPLSVYIPNHPQFNLTFGLKELVISLDQTYLSVPSTAEEHLTQVLESSPVVYRLFEPDAFKDTNLPEIPTDFSYMTCPHAISERSERLGLGRVGIGHIGPAVSSIVKHAAFPVLIPSVVFLPWTSIVVLYGSSPVGVKTVRLGLKLAEQCGVPLRLCTSLAQGESREKCESALEQDGVLERVRQNANWDFWEEGKLKDLLFDIPRDSLVLIGAAAHGALKELLFGSSLEFVQSMLPNTLLVIGAKWNG